MRYINTVAQLHSLQNETYIYAAIVAIAIFGVAFLLSNLTPFEGGRDRSYIKRRIWLIISIVIGSLGFWLYNQFFVMESIKQVAFQNQFSSTNLVCLAVTALGSAVLSVVVMLCFRHSKFGSILGREKEQR